MLINLHGNWIESEMVWALVPARDTNGHNIAILNLGETTQIAIHAEDDIEASDLMNDLAERINVANAAFETIDSRDFGGDAPYSPEATREQEWQHEMYFRQGWDALAKDLVQDYAAADIDRLPWLEDWFESHVLKDLWDNARMDLAQERASAKGDDAVQEASDVAFVTEGLVSDDDKWQNLWEVLRKLGLPPKEVDQAAATVKALLPWAAPTPTEPVLAPQPGAFSAEAVTPALRSDLRRLLAEGGPAALSEAVSALIADQRPEQD